MKERFPRNDLFSLLDTHPTYQLGESTTPDLTVGELLDGEALDRFKDVVIGYGPSLGTVELREMIGRNLNVPADDVLVTVGGASALFMITFVLCDPGDEIVVASPNFPPTIDAMKAVGATLRPVQLRFDDGYRLREQDIRRALSRRTKLVSFVTPQNPSGVAVSRDDCRQVLQAMADVCPDAYLVVDESYREAVYADDPVPPSAADLSPRVLTLASLSKCHGAPGLRIGWLSCRDTDLKQQLKLAKMNMFISCSVVDEALALEVLRQQDRIRGERRLLLGAAVGKVAAWVVREEDYVEWVQPDGGALCCVRLRADVFDDGAVPLFYEAVAAKDAMVANGSWFGDDARVFRLGFGFLPLDVLDQALEQVGAALAQTAERVASARVSTR